MRGVYQLVVVGFLLVLSACGDTQNKSIIDPAGGFTRQDYLDLRERGEKKPKEQDEAAPAIPDLPLPALRYKPPALLQEDLGKALKAEMDEDIALPDKKVSLTLTPSTPLKDTLIELGREGQINLEIDPRIEGGIIFTAYDQPFKTVLRRICDLAGLRYKVDEDFVRIELDEPYQHSYSLPYPSLSRRTTSEITIATNVFDVDVAQGKGGNTVSTSDAANDNNSIAKISSVADASFWSEVEKTIPQVLATTQPRLTKGKDQDSGKEPAANFSLDKQAGLVTIFGTSKQHKAVEAFLQKLESKSTTQVLIEARIVEVELSDEYQSGVNWSSLFDGSLNLAANFGSPGLGAALSAAETGLFSAGLDTGDFSGILKLVKTFGATRVLSSPRLTVLNNQTAVLKVARNEVYFVTSAQFPTTLNASGVTTNGNPVFSSTPRTVPVGLVMTVQPSIDPKSDRVTMTLRPTISRVVDRVNDPSIGLNAAYADASTTVQSKIPVLAVREMDSVLQLQSGEVAIMGGLMQDSSENQDQGVPPFDDIPLVGDLAKSRDNQGKTSELVILLRATILKNAQPDKADIDLYKKYNRDPRPFKAATSN